MTTAFTKDEIARLAADIDGFVDARRESLLELCRELVAARSVNPPGRTIEAAAVVEAFLDGSNVICETLANDPSKPNLISQVNGKGPGAHLILNGHLDTVSPGREADWSVPLFETRIEDGKMTGLGMGNMKAGVAALSLAFVWLKQNTHRWSGRVTLTAVADETVFGPDGAGW
ncbi:MAG: M20/M25/M40 family metallo-hydrolase, partial [Rhizobiales bacterium]|nr:M20/M25/M40 family metallo-hydrolase [Hyphomicrobiales bacterium]